MAVDSSIPLHCGKAIAMKQRHVNAVTKKTAGFPCFTHFGKGEDPVNNKCAEEKPSNLVGFLGSWLLMSSHSTTPDPLRLNFSFRPPGQSLQGMLGGTHF
jgi:hypothetical protein